MSRRQLGRSSHSWRRLLSILLSTALVALVSFSAEDASLLDLRRSRSPLSASLSGILMVCTGRDCFAFGGLV